MNKLHRVVVAVATLAPLVVGCNDSKTASKDNFMKALQGHYDAHPACLSLPLTFPIELSPSPMESRRSQLEALAQVGLVSTTTLEKPEQTFSGQRKAVNYTRYSIAPAGESALHKGADKFLGGSDLCFAKHKITKIESFTEPVNLMGRKVSQVTYDYELVDVASWAKDPAIKKAFPAIGSALAAPSPQQSEGMVLTNTGWKQEHDVQ